MFKMLTPLVLVASLTFGAAANAQTTADPTAPAARSGGFGGLGGLGGLLGGGLPNVGSVGAGNAAGLLGYCLKNRLLGQGGMLGGLTGSQTGTQATPQASGAQSILQQLTGRRDVQTSPGYAAGQVGQVQAGNGQTLSLGNLGGQVKTQLCNVVLKRAKAFL
jgi:hypothetical protein